MILTKYILKKILKKNKKIFLALVIISSLGIAVLTSMLNSYKGIRETFDSYFEEYHFPDVTFFTTELFGKDVVTKVEDVAGVESVQPRLCVEGELIQIKKAGVSVRCYTADETDVLRYEVLEELQEVPENLEKDTVLISIESCFAELAGYQLGDKLELDIDEKKYPCIINKIVTSPECAVVYRDERFHYSTDEFGYVFLTYKNLKEMCNLQGDFYNQLLIQTKGSIEQSEVKEQIKSSGILPKQAEGYTYEESVQKEFVDNCVEPLRVSSYFLSGVFFLIAMIMIYLFVYQIIMEEKRFMGIYMALGISAIQIAVLYLIFGGCIITCAVFLGNVLAYVLMQVMNNIYINAFYLPYMKQIWSTVVVFGAASICALIVQISILLAEWQIFHLEPIQAIRQNYFTATPTRYLQSMKHLGYAEKVCFSSSLRNQRRLLLSYISTILTVAMIVFSLQYMESGREITRHTFTERYCYDAQVVFSEKLTEEKAVDFMQSGKGIAKYELFSDYDTTLSNLDGLSADTTLYGIEADSEMVKMGMNKDGFHLGMDEILLSTQMASELEVQIGDKIKVGETLLTVTGIYDESMFFVQYCSRETLKKINNEGLSGAYLNYQEWAGRKIIYDSLSSEKEFGYLTTKESQKKGTINRLKKTEAAVYIIMTMSFIIGFVIIFNMSLINLKERKKTFSIMMAMGMKPKEIGRATFWELAVQYLISLVIGGVIGLLLGNYLLLASSNELIHYPQAFSMTGILVTVLSVGSFMILGHVLALRKVKQLDIAGELKTTEE